MNDHIIAVIDHRAFWLSTKILFCLQLWSVIMVSITGSIYFSAAVSLCQNILKNYNQINVLFQNDAA